MSPRQARDPAADEARLRRLIARVGGVAPESFGLDDDLRAAAGLDSLSALRLAAAVEREFGITIPDDALQEVTTLGAMCALIATADEGGDT